MKKINFLVLLLISVIFITSCEKKEDSKPPSPKVYIKLNKDVIYPMIGETEDLKVTILSEKEANSELVWKSTDESVATVDNKGKVTAVKKGNAIITVATKDGSKSANCEVNVVDAKITFTSEGREINLSIDAAEEDRENIWIDFNANGKKDEGEKVTEFLIRFRHVKTTVKAITIYGKVTSLNCYNGFTTLDLSKNVALTFLNCSRNENLIKLNVANGNNIKFENSDGFSNGVNYAFKASECPKLKCIKIDEGFNPDAQTEEDKIWIKDDTASYSTTDCK